MIHLDCRLTTDTIPLIQREIRLFSQRYYKLRDMVDEGDMLALEQTVLMRQKVHMHLLKANKRLTQLILFLQLNQSDPKVQYLHTSKNLLTRIVNHKSLYLKINEGHCNPPWKNTTIKRNIHNISANKNKKQRCSSPLNKIKTKITNPKTSNSQDIDYETLDDKKKNSNFKSNQYDIKQNRNEMNMKFKRNEKDDITIVNKDKYNSSFFRQNKSVSSQKSKRSLSYRQKPQSRVSSNGKQKAQPNIKQNNRRSQQLSELLGDSQTVIPPKNQATCLMNPKSLTPCKDISFNNLPCPQSKTPLPVTYTLKLTRQDYKKIMQLKRQQKR